MTAIPAAKVALLGMLQARAGLAGVLVQAGLPAELPVNRERVYIDGATGETIPRQGHPVQENFQVLVVIETRQITGRDAAGYALTEARKWQLYAEVLGTVEDDPELGVAVWWSFLTVQAEVTRPTTDGWFGQVVALLHCARVS